METTLNPFTMLGVTVVGIAGPARSGKDAFAAGILANTGFLKGTRIALADPLRQFVSSITGLSVEELTDGPRKEANLGWINASPRRLMQTVGTEWGRDTVDDQLWLKVAYRRAFWAVSSGDRVIVIPDVRFENEARFIKEQMGGTIVSVSRPRLPSEVPEVAHHISEQGLGDFVPDYSLVNSGTLQYWTDLAGDLAKKLISKGQ